MTGGQECDAPAGCLAVPLMRHQRLALAWMLQREREGSNPRGGLLADDQVRPKLPLITADYMRSMAKAELLGPALGVGEVEPSAAAQLLDNCDGNYASCFPGILGSCLEGAAWRWL